MHSPELTHIELLAQVDELVDRLRQWSSADSEWEPVAHCQAIIKQLLIRTETLRARLAAPLVVATFGGTGTGKSALVNALVGSDCTRSGRERPTTTRPILLTHPLSNLGDLGLPLDDLEVHRVATNLLRDVVLIDCPDPDTTESETVGSNLSRLHRLLPHCDVLIYTATQQKYRSARVVDELGQAASGCRLIFVQTCADLDTDIRDDWRQQLGSKYQVPEIFFVDSIRALREQQAGDAVTGDFRKLQQTLASELAVSQRAQIRRANLLDLIDSALDHCRTHLDDQAPALQRLEHSLSEQKRKLAELMSERLREELLESQNLWERRLLTAVTDAWGFSPFAGIARLYSSLGNLIAAGGLFRARTSAQIALIGAVQGVRWLDSKRKELQAESQLDRIAVCGLDDTVLRQSQLVIAGYAQEARFDPALAAQGNLDALRHEAVRVEDEFLGDAGRRIEGIVRELAEVHSRFGVRFTFEVLLGILLMYIVCRPAYNFFWANPILDKPLLTSDFYIHAVVFFLLWSGLLVMLFTRRLRRGLFDRISELARQLADIRMATGLFPGLERAIQTARLQRDRLAGLQAATVQIRGTHLPQTELGRQLPAPTTLRASASQI
ncbi:MAG: GTPase domain-containing protein [Planctomycetes bacterium]|nr:GTPase domain-containing protein [Planctomycetota bacterium]